MYQEFNQKQQMELASQSVMKGVANLSINGIATSTQGESVCSYKQI